MIAGEGFEEPMKVKVSENGPYVVSGGVPLSIQTIVPDDEGPPGTGRRARSSRRSPSMIGVVEDPALGCSGPLWVRGGITVEAADGKPYEKRNRVTLCRCGASDNKPFCNGSHASMKFDDGLMSESP